MNLFIQESYVNLTENARYGDSEVYETWTDNKGKLYKSLVKELGRCVASVRIDTKNGVKCIGWVFQKRVKFEDSNNTYLREVWITVHKALPVKTLKYQYA